MSARNMAKRTAAGTLALAVCLGGGAIALASAASADTGFKFDQRIQGDDRYGTAVAASKAAFDKADNVILVNGYATVDGLTASYLAGVANAPILYVSDKGADDATKAEIKRLGAKNIWLVGGEKVIPASVADAIKGDGYSVTRINGSDRYETAALIAEAGIKIAGKKPSTVFVASGTSFADALAVSPVAFVKGYPIILTDKDSTSDFSKKELGVIGTDSKVLVGGEAVVSKKVQADLSIKDEQRVAGADRAVTANLVSDWAKKSQGFNPANAALVGGTNGNGADSLVAAPLLGKSFTTLHFAGWDATNVYLKDHANELTGKGFVFGGKAAVPGDQVDKAQAAAQSVVNTQTLKFGQTDDVSVAFEKVRQYSVSGLDKDTKYRVTLVNGDKIIKKDGNVTFTQDGTTGLADAGDVESKLTVVNGVSVTTPAQSQGGIAPADGTISFTVTSDDDTVENLIPVIYVDGGANTRLEIDSAGRPTEKFGVGGAIQVLPPEADKGNDTPGELIKVVNKSAGYFATGDFTYKLSDKDTYYTGADDSTQNRVTKDAFLKTLSQSDTLVEVTYNPDFGSIFVVENTSPQAPTSVSHANGSVASSEVKLSWPASATDSVVGYNIYANKEARSATTKSELVKIGSTTGRSGEAATSFVAKGLSATSTYTFVVTAVDKSGEESGIDLAAGTNIAEHTTGSVTETTPPTIINAEIADTGSVPGILDAGDTIVVDFSENMDANLGVNSSTYLRIADSDAVVQVAADGTVNKGLLNGGGASTTTTTSDGSLDRLRITVGNSGLTTISGGTSASIDLTDGAKISLVSPAFKDTAGNALDLSKSADIRLDDEGHSSSINAVAYGAKATNTFQTGLYSLTAKNRGTAGNDITLVVQAGASNSIAEPIAVAVNSSTKVITVTLADNNANAITSTVTDVVAAINAKTEAAALVQAAVVSGGSTTATTISSTHLAGGTADSV